MSLFHYENMKKDTLFIAFLAAVFLCLAGMIIWKNYDKHSINQQTESPVMEKKQYAAAPAMQIDSAKQYQAVLKTDAGEITIQLNAALTPVTVNNFVFLAREGFYNGTPFHRTLEGFMIQGGDPLGTGMGGPGYRFDDEPFEGEYTRGTIAMANAGPNTNGSQFFIMHQDYPLSPNYVIFGHVTSGMEIVDTIATAPVMANARGEESTPVTPVKILSVEIMEQ
jgi:cyclophilin family peptidyl-prolyl cis-trans isomerase